MAELPTTQRAYTLRLRGIEPNDNSWRDALWATHEAVNKGAKVFGEWLLTLRGGLCHTLADEKVAVKVKGKEVKRNPTPEERKGRRILLALSWLAVEDATGAPEDELLIVAKGTDSADCRERKLCDALVDILKKRGVDGAALGDPNKDSPQQPGTWLGDCMPSLSAEIREDAVWVNRSRSFDSATQQCPSLSRGEVWDFLEPFFVNAESYLKPEKKSDSDGAEAVASAEKSKDLVQKAGGWLSKRTGTGSGADFEKMSRAYSAIADWANDGRRAHALEALAEHLAEFIFEGKGKAGVLSIISGPGYKSATRNHINKLNETAQITSEDLATLLKLATEDAKKCREKIGEKGRRPYSDAILKSVQQACGFGYLRDGDAALHQEFSVMLDHAARHASVAHSWIKRAEAERSRFEEDAQRINSVPQDALAWLQQYCSERTSVSGTQGEYRIRRRAIDAWDKVVDRWSRAACKTVDDRIESARQLQDDPEIDKFGDINLFEALAEESAYCVWKPNEKPSAQPLKDFVAATDAEANKKRFKVPAYRHPDPLQHPVFVDFGNSRWGIDYSSHRAPTNLEDTRARVEKLSEYLEKAEKSLASAKEAQREQRQEKVDKCRDKLEKVQGELDSLLDRFRLVLELWNEESVQPIPMRWSCKRLVSDLAIGSDYACSNELASEVSRSDRLGRAAAGGQPFNGVSIAGLFSQKYWNGRLQAPRAQLDAIARHVEKHGWDARARKLVERLRWLISFSAELTPLGPWPEYCERFADDALARPFISSRKGEYAVKHNGNDNRKAHAKLILSRLPGLRVLSVDLGHRYAAACAVWEAISKEDMELACTTASVAPPSDDAMYVHLNGVNSSGKPRTTIYRRIGADTLPGGSPHPAPWARLDRQFLIKLQGEDRPVRKASPDEIQAVEDFEQWAGQKRHKDFKRKTAVDLLMSDAVRTARLALERHGRRARIARDLIETTRILPGNKLKNLDKEEDRVELRINALVEWHTLATDARWDDEKARQLWNEHLAELTGSFRTEPVDQSQETDEPTKAQQREAKKKLRKRLTRLAAHLEKDESLRKRLCHAWEKRWNDDDTEWRKKLKWLSHWLMPRGHSRSEASHRHVGGLSLRRITTLTEFRRKVQVGYFTRLKLNGDRDEIGPQFGQTTLDRIKRLKDQRIGQLVSRIVEAALGVGKDTTYREVEKNGKNVKYQLKRPELRIDDPRFAPCHAVIIENLTHYRPEQTRTRRENRATMDWKSAEVRKRLEDHCQLYGLHLRDVNPQYTSRQDAFTGAPGVRCSDVPVKAFMQQPWWRKQVARAEKTKAADKGDARELFLCDLNEKWKDKDAEWENAGTIRIHLDGGELLVSANKGSPLARGFQADLNAAANIGLRALMDPDFAGRWWYVPCSETDGTPHPDKVKGSACFGDTLAEFGSLRKKLEEPDNGVDSGGKQKEKSKRSSRKTKKSKEITNFWADPSGRTLKPSPKGFWLETPAYWAWVRKRVVAVIRTMSGIPSREENCSPADENLEPIELGG